MVSTVRSRPNYYEMLGLTPSAGSDAIAQAFARESSVFRPHAFGGIVELCLAYQTLRDPVRRRAYDVSLGLVPEPARRNWSMAPQGKPYRGSASARPVMRIAAPSPPAPLADREPRPEPRPRHRPEAAAGPVRRPVIADELPPPLAFDERLGIAISPKRTGVVVGGLVAAAILFGGLAGWWSGSDAAEPQAEAAESTIRPPAKRVPSLAELWPDPAPQPVESRPDRPRRIVARARRVERAPDPPQLSAAEMEPAPVEPLPSQADSGAADPLAAEPQPAPASTAAALPLPDRTVARTLDRIGYACGKVTSTVAVEGESSGVYKVTCTSGQSYQARPVNGRYRFRRWGRN